jgi:transcriptional regulator with XRE-family HTH domain
MRKDGRAIIGKRIKELRESQGYTPTDIAGRLKINEMELYKIEEGKFSLELFHILVSILRVLERSIQNHWAEHRDELYLSKPTRSESRSTGLIK